jgi:hypothetical protein
MGFAVRRWQARGAARNAAALPLIATATASAEAGAAKRDDYDARLDDELKDLDG